MKKEYKKIIRIQKLSKVVGCLQKFEAKKIELLLLVVIIVLIILCLMNVLVIPWKILNKSLFGLRIVILVFLIISLICISYNQIFRKRKKLTFGYYYCISFFSSLINIGLTLINFLFLLISCFVVAHRVKNYQEKRYDYKSILVIDIFSLIIFISKFFLWYSEFLRVYAKTDGNLKDFIESKIRFYQSQNQKIVNVQINNDVGSVNKPNDKDFAKIKGKSIDDDVISNNKMINSEKQFHNINNSGSKKDDDISSVDTK